MKVYLSARFGRQEEMQSVARRIRCFGHEVVSSWIDHEVEPLDPEDAPGIAERELEEIRELCDVMIHFSEEPGTPGAARGGRLVEFGMAAALGKRLIVVGPVENIFHQIPGVARFETIGVALAYLEHT